MAAAAKLLLSPRTDTVTGSWRKHEERPPELPGKSIGCETPQIGFSLADMFAEGENP